MDKIEQDQADYEAAWDEEPTAAEPSNEAEEVVDVADESEDKPVENAVKAAAEKAALEQAKQFAEAFHSEAPMEPEPQPEPFGAALAKAKDAGETSFEWNGKRYATEKPAKA